MLIFHFSFTLHFHSVNTSKIKSLPHLQNMVVRLVLSICQMYLFEEEKKRQTQATKQSDFHSSFPKCQSVYAFGPGGCNVQATGRVLLTKTI